MSDTPQTIAVCVAEFETWEEKATQLANLSEKLERDNARLRDALKDIANHYRSARANCDIARAALAEGGK